MKTIICVLFLIICFAATIECQGGRGGGGGGRGGKTII